MTETLNEKAGKCGLNREIDGRVERAVRGGWEGGAGGAGLCQG